MSGLINPARRAEAVTPNDSTTFDTARGFHVGGAGDVTVDMEDVGTNITFTGCLAGVFYPYTITRIYATGTSATNIVLLR